MLKTLRPRFRLRTLLLLFVAVAVFCWWKNEPRRQAAEFAKHVNAGELDEATAMITDWSVSRSQPDLTQALPGRAELLAQSWRQWWAGEARVTIRYQDAFMQSILITRGGVQSGRWELIPELAADLPVID